MSQAERTVETEMRVGAEPEALEASPALVQTMNPYAMTVYAELCGRTPARAHARSGDPIAIARYLGNGDTFDRALASFAEAYADQNERDDDALERAVASGRATAGSGL